MRRAARVDENQAAIVAAEAHRAVRAARAEFIARVLKDGGDFKDAAASLGVSRSVVSLTAKEFGIRKTPSRVVSRCRRCGAAFEHYKSAARIFCSYACHLESGGARRAGDAAAMAKRKYGAKKDANHSEIFGVIGALTAVHDLSNVGCGCPDGLAWVDGGWQLFDVKNPQTGYGRRGLNKRQKEWASDWRGGPVYLIHDIEEAERFAKGNLDGLKREGGCA